MNNNGSIKFYTILKLKIGWSHFLFTTDDSNVLNLIEFIEFMINHISWKNNNIFITLNS